MKEIPILFSTQMIQALLAGRKTMTRRIVKPQPPGPQGTSPAKWIYHYWGGSPFNSDKKRDPERHELVDGFGNCFTPKKNYGKPGDILWVRESYSVVERSGKGIGNGFIIFADEWSDNKINETAPYRQTQIKFGGHPSIHMPKAAARIWLEVTNVRVERLRQITEEDAIAEGIEKLDDSDYPWRSYLYPNSYWQDPIGSFESLWESINGFKSFDQNPWVWVVSFNVLSTTGKP